MSRYCFLSIRLMSLLAVVAPVSKIATRAFNRLIYAQSAFEEYTLPLFRLSL